MVARLKARRGKVDDVGTESQLGEIERRERARALFEEHVDASLTGQQRSGSLALELGGPFEDVRELFG